MRTILTAIAIATLLTGRTAVAVTIEIGNTRANPGDTVEIDVILRTMGDEVAGVSNDIHFPDAIDFVECRLNLALGREATAFAPKPSGCSGGSCEFVRALVLSFSDLSPIPDGSVLYSCRFALPNSAADGAAFLTCREPEASSPNGSAVASLCADGFIQVGGGPDLPTLTPRPVPSRTPVPTATIPPTATPTPTTAPASSDDTVFVDTDLFSITGDAGGSIRIYAQVFDSNVDPVDGVDVSFSHSPDVGTLRVVSARSGSVIVNGVGRSGVAEARLEIPPGESPTGIVITADAGFDRIGETTVEVVDGVPESPIDLVLVQTADNSCGARQDPLVLEAIVFNEDRVPVNGRPVLFTGEIGRFRSDVVQTQTIESQAGVAHVAVDLPTDVPVKVDPATGAILPYLFYARAGTVEGSAQVFIVPGREPCDDGSTPVPTRTPISEDRTRPPRATNRPTRTQSLAFGGAEDDGCSVTGATRSPSIAWLGFALLATLRRRRVRHAR